jgi:hypothetical protein
MRISYLLTVHSQLQKFRQMLGWLCLVHRNGRGACRELASTLVLSQNVCVRERNKNLRTLIHRTELESCYFQNASQHVGIQRLII